MSRRISVSLACAVLLAASACRDTTQAPTGIQPGTIAADQGQGLGEVLRGAVIHRPLDAGQSNAPPVHGGGGSVNLLYGGGTGGIGVQTAPKIYLVVWGSQWNSGDPSGEVGILQSFYSGMGGSPWLNSVTQYCQGVAVGTIICGGNGVHAGNQSGLYAATWTDNTSAAPSHPSQNELAAEAVRAAAHFGNTGAGSNNNTQYVIATASGNSSTGFKTQYCAYHSSTGSSYGNISYTNLPYLTDAGASCGANFNGLGPKAGITIVSGHEAAEAITDPFPNSGWLDSKGAENGDKCAWISTGSPGASQNITLSTGTFAIQTLWSNAFNSNAGGCVASYP